MSDSRKRIKRNDNDDTSTQSLLSQLNTMEIDFDLLKLTVESGKPASLNSQFASIAEYLMRHCTIVVPKDNKPTKFAIRELEFYYRSIGSDDCDPYIHGDPLQKERGAWYFHRLNGKGFKGGTFKGLDLAFGDENAYGGILLRSIENVETREVVDGSCLVVEALLKAAEKDSIDGLLGGKTHISAVKKNAVLYIEALAHDLDVTEIISTPRVGLCLKKEWDIDKIPPKYYLVAPWRFFVTDASSHLKKGRCHAAMALHHRDLPVSEIIKKVGGTKASVSKWVATCDDTRKSKADLKAFYGSRIDPSKFPLVFGVLWKDGILSQ